MNGMLELYEHIETVSMRQESKERVDGEYKVNVTDIVVQFNPHRLYIRSEHDGEVGAEIIYRSDVNPDKAYIAPHSFPYFNLNLDPQGYLMRKGRHHTIFNAGGVYLAEIIGRSLKEAVKRREFEERFRYAGKREVNGILCELVEIWNEDFAYIPYEVKEGEDLISIAQRKGISEFMVLEKNPEIDFYDDVEVGQVIMIPNFYAKRVLLYMDPKRFVPIKQQIYAEDGLFAEYVTHWVKLHPKLSEDTFSPENPKYGF